MSGKVKNLVVIFVLAAFLWQTVILANPSLAENLVWDLDERPKTEEELHARLPWYLKDYKVDDQATAWEAVTTVEGGSEAYEGRAAFTFPLLDGARVEITMTVELRVPYEPTTEDLTMFDESGLPVYGFVFETSEQDGRQVTHAVGYIPEELLEQTKISSLMEASRLPATSPAAVGRYVKIAKEVVSAAGMGKGILDTRDRHLRLRRMMDLAQDIVDDTERARIIETLRDSDHMSFAVELYKGGVGIGSTVLAPQTLGLSLAVGGGAYLCGMAADWAIDRRIEEIRNQMIDLDVDVNRPEGVVDISGLQSLLYEIEQLDDRDYTSESWSRLAGAIAQARLVLENPESQNQVNASIQWLTSARTFLFNNLSGFKAAPAAEGVKERGASFDLKITDARNESGWYHVGREFVEVVSNLEQDKLFDGEAAFTGGNATVPVVLYTDGEHTLTVSVAGVSRPRTLQVTVVVSSGAWVGIITNDENHDFRPRTDGVCDTWVKVSSADVDLIEAALMYRDESGIRQIADIKVSARLASPLETIRLEIDKGWVFWQFLNPASEYESWIYDPVAGQAILLVTATDTEVPASDFRFDNGRVLWVDKSWGLMFFDGVQIINLAAIDRFHDHVLNGGWVVWRERPENAEYWNSSHIKLYDGNDILNLSEIGDAAGHIGHFQAGTDGARGVWKGMKYQNSSVEDIFCYDGSSVKRLTNDNPGPVRHLRFWMDQAVWQRGAYELYLWDGQEKVLVTGSLPAENEWSMRRHWDFREGKVVWHEHFDFQRDGIVAWWDGPSGPISVYDTTADMFRQLPWKGGPEDEDWDIRNLQFDGHGVCWVVTVFIGDPSYTYRHVLKLHDWKSDQTLILDDYDDPAGHFFLSFYQRGNVVWSRREVSADARWWFWKVPAAGGDRRWETGTFGIDGDSYHDTEIFRYSPDTGTLRLTRNTFEPDDARLEGFSHGRVIWSGLRLPSRGELPVEGTGTKTGSTWGERDSWREIYAREMAVSSEDFLKSAIRGLQVLTGENIDLNLGEHDFNTSGRIDLDDLIHALQRASGLK